MLAATFHLKALAAMEGFGVHGGLEDKFRQAVPSGTALQLAANPAADAATPVLRGNVDGAQLASAWDDRPGAQDPSGRVASHDGCFHTADDGAGHTADSVGLERQGRPVLDDLRAIERRRRTADGGAMHREHGRGVLRSGRVDSGILGRSRHRQPATLVLGA